MVDQDDELLGRSRDNLFLQECAASALDEIEAWIDLICPVDRDIDHPDIIGIDEGNSLLLPSMAVSFDVALREVSCPRGPFPQRDDHMLGVEPSRGRRPSIANKFDGF